MVEESGTLESQLEATKVSAPGLVAQRDLHVTPQPPTSTTSKPACPWFQVRNEMAGWLPLFSWLKAA